MPIPTPARPSETWTAESRAGRNGDRCIARRFKDPADPSKVSGQPFCPRVVRENRGTRPFPGTWTKNRSRLCA